MPTSPRTFRVVHAFSTAGKDKNSRHWIGRHNEANVGALLSDEQIAMHIKAGNLVETTAKTAAPPAAPSSAPQS